MEDRLIEAQAAQIMELSARLGVGDWPEDTQHENGNYSCRCVHCGGLFIGHKRRVCCKTCAHRPCQTGGQP